MVTQLTLAGHGVPTFNFSHLTGEHSRTMALNRRTSVQPQITPEYVFAPMHKVTTSTDALLSMAMPQYPSA